MIRSALIAFLCAASTAQLDVRPGPVASFDINAPASARVGEATTIRIVARDASGNIVRDYASTGGGIVLATSTSANAGVRTIDPDRFAASAFRDGVLDAAIVLSRAGATEIIVTDPSARVTSRTGRIDVRPGAISSIRILPPTEARVNEPFDVAIELYDRFGNPLVDYDRFGGELVVRNGYRGAVGRFDPARISPTLFSQGRALVRLRYSQAERTAIEIEADGVRSVSTPFDIRAGALHSLGVSVPSRRVIAGEPFAIMVEAKDEGGNTITDYDRVGSIIELKSSGTGRLEPSSIPPTAFASGVAMVNVRYNVAEAISIIAHDPSGARRGESSGKIEVLGGRLGRIEILPAENARAGAPLAVQLIGYDVFGNLIRDYSNRSLRIVLSSTAGAIEAPAITASSFRDGVAIITITPMSAGPLVLQAVDEATGAGGRSAPIRVQSGVVAAYEVRAPMAAVAHEPFDVEIRAVDRFGNPVEDYNRVGSGVVLEKPGQGEISPASLPASAFIDGVARAQVTYNIAGEITIGVVEKGGTASGRSSSIIITHAAPRKFVVSAPPQTIAGEPTRIAITALDDFGNAVVTYAAMNRTVTLYAENGDPIAPPIVASTVFRQGTAEMDVVFFRSGDAVVVAEEMSGTVIGKSNAIRVLPGRPAHLLVSAPARAKAGTPAIVRIEMRDKLGNRIRDYSPASASLSIRILGVTGGVLPSSLALGDIRRMVFREGIAEISVLPQAMGEIIIEVKDEMLGVAGKSQNVLIEPGPVDRFRVESLSQAALRANEPMKLRITALDAFGNPVIDYGADGSGVRLIAEIATVNGKAAATGVFIPSTLRGEAFVEGRADIYALYDKAEAVEVKVDRIAPGAMTRPEVAGAVAMDRAGGTLISILGNSPLRIGEVRRLTESLFEVMIPGAILSARGGVTRPGGIVSLVTMTQAEEGVKVLLHATGPAVLRTGAELNRILIDVDPVIAVSRPPAIIPAMPVTPATPSQPVARPPITGYRLADVDRLVRENRFAEALAAVNAMIAASPDDVSLQNLRRRLETLNSIMRTSPPPPPPEQLPALQIPPQPVQHSAPQTPPVVVNEMAGVEAAVRSGNYREALSLLESYIMKNPRDESAIRMKARIEQMIRLMNQ